MASGAGFLEGYRKVEGMWSGFVRYSLASGRDASRMVRGGGHPRTRRVARDGLATALLARPLHRWP